MPTTLEQSVHKYFLESDLFFDTKIDERLKWLPFATIYLLDIFGVRTRSSWRKQIVLTAATEAIRYFIADNLKTFTDERRPIPYFNHRSFPSGHTCSSFAGAEFMHQELKDTHRLFSYTGYVGATGVAIIRLMKSKHWLKDVVAGAVIGICVTKIAYAIIDNVSNRLHHHRQKSQEIIQENL